MKKLLVLLLTILLASASFAQEEEMPKIQQITNSLFEAYNNEDYDSMADYYSEEMLSAFSLEQSKTLFSNIMSEYGKLVSLSTPFFTEANQAIFMGEFEKGELKIAIAINEKGEVMGFVLGQNEPEIPVPERNETAISLPFSGQWLVLWGGDLEEENYHKKFKSQQYGFDFTIIDEEGKPYEKLGENNEDYYAFGKEVLAPADGTVTDVITGVRDNPPGFKNPFSALGNAIYIKHSENEISILAHLKEGSITVKAGDTVKKGQVIGLCGNSGNSSHPHIHYHIQNTPFMHLATGIKCYFEKIILTKNGDETEKIEYSPSKGEFISNPPQE